MYRPYDVTTYINKEINDSVIYYSDNTKGS